MSPFVIPSLRFATHQRPQLPNSRIADLVAKSPQLTCTNGQCDRLGEYPPYAALPNVPAVAY